MDDADRRGISVVSTGIRHALKTSILIGFLVFLGAGCSATTDGLTLSTSATVAVNQPVQNVAFPKRGRICTQDIEWLKKEIRPKLVASFSDAQKKDEIFQRLFLEKEVDVTQEYSKLRKDGFELGEVCIDFDVAADTKVESPLVISFVLVKEDAKEDDTISVIGILGEGGMYFSKSSSADDLKFRRAMGGGMRSLSWVREDGEVVALEAVGIYLDGPTRGTHVLRFELPDFNTEAMTFETICNPECKTTELK